VAGIEASTLIDAPPDRVFATITDLENAPGRLSAIKRLEVLTDGPVGVGTRFRETRVMFGREATAEIEITGFEPGRSYTTESASCGCRYFCSLAVAPERSGTRLTASFGVTPLTLPARLMNAVMMPLMRKSMVRAFQQELADIKAWVETGR
jgi:hypothetical protein